MRRARSKRGATAGSSKSRATAGGADAPVVPDASVVPISHLSPDLSRCTIRARVVEKWDELTSRNDRGAGYLMLFRLSDQSGEITAAVFNENRDRLGPLLTEGRVLDIQGGLVNACPEHSAPSGHKYEVTLDSTT